MEDEIPPEEDPSFAMTLQQELLAVSPDLLAPAAAELDMLRREKERHTHELKRLELKKESIREQKERIERLVSCCAMIEFVLTHLYLVTMHS